LDESKSITVVVGEEGIGKSTFLREFSKKLKERNDSPFVGIFDNNSVVEDESQSSIFPFIAVLEILLRDIQKTARTEERINITLNRWLKASEKFAKEKGKEIAGAIVTDIAKKIGLDEVIKVGKEYWRFLEGEKSIFTVMQDYISKYKGEALTSYISILTSLAEQFHDRKFVLIFDQFESAKKTAIDFFINFVKVMPQEGFHIIVSFKTYGQLDDNTSNEIYGYAIKKSEKIGAHTLKLSGLSEEEIGEWIITVRKQKISTNPYLKRIKEASSGFPLLLEQWINMPISDKEWIDKAKKSGFRNVNRGQMCEFVDLLRESFSSDISDRVNLNKIAVLIMPLKINELTRYLEYNFDYLALFLEKLVKSGIFVNREKYLWYKHNLIQKCLENRLFDEYKQKYLERAAQFYTSSLQELDINRSEPYNNTSIGCAYYLHAAGLHDKSLEHNEKLARVAFNYGDLDLAEECYQRAIIDAQVLGKTDKKMYCLLELSRNVYMFWGGRHDEAKKNYDSIRDYSIKVGNHDLEVLVLSELAKYYDVTENNYVESLRILTECLSMLDGKQSKIPNMIPALHYEKATILKKQEKYKEALYEYQFFASSMNQSESTRDSDSQYYSIWVNTSLYRNDLQRNIADIYRIIGEYDEALKLYELSLSNANLLGNQLIIAETLNGIARVYYERGYYDEALKKNEERLTIEEKTGHQMGIAITKGEIGRIYIKKNMNDKARQFLGMACDMLKELGRSQDAAKYQVDLNSI
jgi:tetratricopeptide (TPR) repeat protein